ncbi:Smr/MutS family protein [Formosa algae]|uniref:DNA-nicking Smr family endonuclease n=1 Tax=Formosa algae TaxID=225843 RepID=A0A9X1CDD4_9FLAO|nr:Smr/MutS family protein [Formosa algae]MBP1841114.1 DNA-nicking Smr family endonuclease [Formosa algae]MDQ0336466.1 DNA-nicking Smr family endonuclease [Formosa algae]OEI81427.1 DNA mismatch repair protein MutS [Formosa algae]PNW26576.1 DNA mismatch repair protein MutS [Formosa algae]
MSFKKGDVVSVLDEDISGTVLKVEGQTVSVETEDGFILNFEAQELIKIKSDKHIDSELFRASSLSQVISEKEEYKPKKSVRIKPKERFEPTMEVDLHIHNLTKSTKNMENYDMLTLQLDTAKHKLEFAMKNRIQKVVFIHGVGEGVLKMELEYLFNHYDNLKYYDANYQKYGVGATEVYIFQNVK